MEDLNQRIAALSPAKRALLEMRLKQSGAALISAPVIIPRADRHSAIVSFAQQRLWFLDQLEPNSASYNVPRAIKIEGLLDTDALSQTLNALVARHEPFRTRFASVDGTVRQIIDDEAQIDLPVLDLRDLPADERDAKARQLSAKEAARPFNLAHGPVIRSRVLRLGEREHILLLTTHHIVSDAWSAGILFRELGELYDAFASGQPSTLAPLPIQYADFAEWQRQWLQGEVLEEQLAYWQQQLDGATSTLNLPTDRPRPSQPTFRGEYKFRKLSEGVSQELAQLSKREGATLFMTLLAAFQTLLWRYTDQDDIVVGSPIAGRNRAETEGLIGFFINTLALRTSLAGDPTFRELLARVKEVAVGAYAHQDLPFEKLVEELQPERDLRRNPLFQVMFQFQNTARSLLKLQDLTLTSLDVSTKTSKFDLTLAALEEAGRLSLVMEYSTDLFDGQTIERMLHHYATLLEGIVINPDARIASLPLMTEAECHQLVVEWNHTEAEFPADRCIHQLFEEQAARTPEATAVAFGGEQINYSELNARANQLARYLREHGVGPEARVAVGVERSIDMIVGLLGILKAGGAYVPLETSYPAERIAFILEDSRSQLLLTQESLLTSLPPSNARTICLDGDWENISGESKDNLATAVTAENAAHVIYTSGSTGRPKGVLSAHRASINRFAWMWRQYPFARDEVCCQKTSLSFVDSIWEIFGPLLQGVPLVIIQDEVVKDPRRFASTISSNRVTRLVLVPSLLRVILESDNNLAESLRPLRYCISSGETLPNELATEFNKKLPRAKLINLYGSSEVAADVTCYEVKGTTNLGNIPIGRPIANTRVLILNENLQPAPVGVPGEIFIGGDGLARGYFDRPELTAERFIPDPFSTQPGARLFRTGDLGRYLAEGNIEYRGRRDNQVKVRGFRIELGEIESVLSAHPQVDQAVVIARDDAGDKRLAAYVVANGNRPAATDLRAHLRGKLPEYMVPSAFVMLDSLPLTASGKVNRLALPATDQLQTAEEFMAPRTTTEDVLANIWAEVLNLERVGMNDDFFSLGGHSLLLARVASRIGDAFEVELPLRALFEASTVSALAERIETQRRAKAGRIEPPVVALPRNGRLPLSFAQEPLWFFDQLEPGSAAYNIPRALRLKGALNKQALQQSLDAIVARHEVLRTNFLNDNGRPALRIAENAGVEIQLIDLRHLATGERESRTRTLAAQEVRQPFDLASDRLLRAIVIRLGEEDHVLLLTMHHTISDGWSMGVLLRELVESYNAITNGRDPSLPKLTVQYADFAAWQRQFLAGPQLENQLEYWRGQLDRAPEVIQLPLDRMRPPVRSFRGAKQPLIISREIANGLIALARSERATVFMALLTVFQLLLATLTKEDDIVVGSPTAGRNLREVENVIGYFVNTLVLRARLAGDPSFRQTLRRVREVALGAYANQDVPFEKLVEELRPQRSLSYNLLFQVWFVLQNAQVEREQWHGLTVESLDIDSGTTRHDLQLTLWETDNGFEGAFTYSTDLFEAETIACVTQQLYALLNLVVAQPEIRLSALRAKLDEVGREYRTLLASNLEQAGRDRLKSIKRRAITEPQNLTEEAWAGTNQ
jgi:amino acid adenylation domain-containing protein